MSQDNILSISSLNLHSPKNWKIVARVKYLSDIKDGPTGKYFYVDLFDSIGEIRAIAYNSEAFRFRSIFEENRNKDISIENGIIQRINDKFKDKIGVKNDFEIKLLEHSIVKEKDSSVASQSQHNELIEDRTQNSIAIDTREIDKRQKTIDILELELAIKKLDLGCMKKRRDLVKKLNDKRLE